MSLDYELNERTKPMSMYWFIQTKLESLSYAPARKTTVVVIMYHSPPHDLGSLKSDRECFTGRVGRILISGPNTNIYSKSLFFKIHIRISSIRGQIFEYPNIFVYSPFTKHNFFIEYEYIQEVKFPIFVF